MLKFGYVIIDKKTNRCCQVIETNNGNWMLNNSTHFSMMVDVSIVAQFIGKYFYDNTWWRREWVYEEAVDEYGNKYQKQTEEYTDYVWTPEAVNN